MTLAELERYFESRKRVEKARAQEKASFDYILADLIGRSISRVYSSGNTIPDISTVYPTLFDNKEIEEKRAQANLELSALRFRLYANNHNKKFS